MELLLESITAFFAAVGITWFVWTAAQKLLFTPRRMLEKCIVVIPAAQDAPALECTVRTLAETLICGQQLDKILIADCGLTEEALALARKLAQEHDRVALCSADRIEEETE